MSRIGVLLLALAVLAVGNAGWGGQSEMDRLKAELAGLPEVKKASSPAAGKIAPQVRQVLDRSRQAGPAAKSAPIANRFVRLNDAGEIQVYVDVEKVTDATLRDLRSGGLRVEIANSELKTVQGWIPLRAVERLAARPSVRRIRPPSFRQLRAGSVMTQGDAILRANMVRARGIDGSGAKVGAISDGMTNRAVSQTVRDLPSVIQIDPRFPGEGDAGTALLEIVYDIAPGASLAFSGPYTSLEFIQGLDYLVDTARCNVVFDDVGFYDEPYFEDGPVARAVATALTSGVVYVSACGNDAQRHYQAMYTDWNPGATGWPNNLHLFGPGDADMEVIIPPATEIAVFLQWAEPWGHASSDYDLFLYDDRLTTALAWSNAIQNGDDNPYEAFSFRNSNSGPIRGRILVNRASGAARLLEMFLWDVSWQEHVISADSIFGHPAVPGVLSVAAINASDPGNDTIAPYTSLGRSTIAIPVLFYRQTPRVTGIDGVSVTGAGGHPNPYYGTSAAAAHAAGIAALVISSNRGLSPDAVVRRMETGCVDLGVPGWDFVYGYGRLNAYTIEGLAPSAARYWNLLP